MKTDELINALAADAAASEPPIGRTMAVALAVGVTVSAAILFGFLGVRSDLAAAAAQSWRLPAKFAVVIVLAASVFALTRRLIRPDGDARGLWPLLLAAPAMLLCGVAMELSQPDIASSAGAIIMVPNRFACVMFIPLLSLAPFAAVLYALKQGAPANPTLAGAVGGLLSAALGATLYASYCNADSPLFVAVWYPLGIAAMTALGALIGSRLLRW